MTKSYLPSHDAETPFWLLTLYPLGPFRILLFSILFLSTKFTFFPLSGSPFLLSLFCTQDLFQYPHQATVIAFFCLFSLAFSFTISFNHLHPIQPPFLPTTHTEPRQATVIAYFVRSYFLSPSRLHRPFFPPFNTPIYAPPIFNPSFPSSLFLQERGRISAQFWYQREFLGPGK